MENVKAAANFQNRKINLRWWKFLLLFAVAIVLSFGVERFLSLKGIIYDAVVASFGNAAETSFNLSDMVVNGYDVDGNTLTDQTGDPNVSKYEINTYISDLTIKFSEPIEQDIAVAIYYSENENEFTSSQVYSFGIARGQTEAKIELNRYIVSLRMDLTNEIGAKIVLDSVSINENIQTFADVQNNLWKNISFDRIQLFFILFSFIGLYFIVGWKTLNNWLFRYRWIVAGALFLFLVLNKYHGSSIGMFDTIIQPGQGSEYNEPIFGTPRGIRSDEWLVSTPNRLTATFSDFGPYNDILRGTHSPNLLASGLYFGYSGLAKVLCMGFYLFGNEYGQSIVWFASLILQFMISFEFFLIVAKRKRLPALVGASVVGFSAFFYWWGQPLWIIQIFAIIVCLYYFLQTDKKHVKILCGLGTALAAANFVAMLYPAWQVPAAYLLLGLLVWLGISNWDKVKALRLFDWCLIGAGIAFMVSIILVFLRDNSAYTTAISETVYPGSRISSGGYALYKAWNYVATPLLPFKDIGNATEPSTIMTFFPLPLIMLLYQMIRGKKKDALSIILLGLSVVFGSYIITGWPVWLSKLTLMSYSLEWRTADIFILIQALILVIVLSRFDDVPKMPWYVGLPLSIGSVAIAFLSFTRHNNSEYLSPVYILVYSIVFVAFCCVVTVRLPNNRVWQKLKKGTCLIIVLISVVSAMSVHPLMKGLDVFYSKPVSKEIQSIVAQDPDAKWVSPDFTVSPFAAVNGASTLTTVNNVPNMELWRRLDPSGQYDEVYNRYAHVVLSFTEGATSFVLIQTDLMRIELNYQDIALTGCKYILSRSPLEGGMGVIFREIYNEYGCYIYEVDTSAVVSAAE